jgi:hypothetical protein
MIDWLFARTKHRTRQSDGGVRWRSLVRGSATLCESILWRRVADLPISMRLSRRESLGPLRFENGRAETDKMLKRLALRARGFCLMRLKVPASSRSSEALAAAVPGLEQRSQPPELRRYCADA